MVALAGPATFPNAASPEEEGGGGDDDDIFAELRTTRCTSWQYELRQLERVNQLPTT